MYLLSLVLPNLVKLDLSNLDGSRHEGVLRTFAEKCPSLSTITWNGGCSLCDMNGMELREASNLVSLSIDGIHCQHYSSVSRNRHFAGNGDYMFCYCTRLERVSIKGATIEICRMDRFVENISQNWIIDMVRRHPTLRWLRSDLSAENVQMLRQERPDITFVSE